MFDIKRVKFDENGLIPVIVQDAQSGGVLTLAYMNAESLQISLDEGRTCFWSRSRGELWRKGETSGNVQRIVSIEADCDMDALLVKVNKEGPACHTGAESCFINDIYAVGSAQNLTGGGVQTPAGAEVAGSGAFSLKTLHDIILDRRENAKPGSYTTYLFDKGLDKILKKIGEESTEVIIASKAGDKGETVYELADLTYHAFVLMTEMGIDPGEIVTELASRYTGKDEN